MDYIAIFFISLISGSLFPLGSEAFLLYYLQTNNCYILILSASLGNTLGSLINYFLGYKGKEFLLKKKIIDLKKLERGEFRFKKYGSFALFLSPLPIIGDPITFIAGVFRYDLKKFILIVFFAKTIRYIAVANLINF
jgi:membrane protein YqaA with SNARE-associated domain